MYRYIALFITLILSWVSEDVTAGGDIRPTGSRSASLGNASVAIADIWSAFNNQAGLAFVTDPGFGISYESRFTMKETGYSALAAVYPVNHGTIGFSACFFGFTAYNETRFGLAYAKSFGKKLAFALQLDYLRARFQSDYNSRGIVTFEAGMLADVTNRLRVGVHVYNPVSARFAEFSDERVPAVLSIGFSYALSQAITLLAEAEKSMATETDLNAGIEYKLHEKIQLRAGVSTGQSVFSFGTGYETGRFLISISTSWHTLLGYSPQISITCKF